MAKKEEKKRIKRPTALKRHMQNQKKRELNHAFKSRVRSAMRAVQVQAKSDDDAALKQAVNDAYSLLDKSVKRGIFKRAKADRLKAKLAV